MAESPAVKKARTDAGKVTVIGRYVALILISLLPLTSLQWPHWKVLGFSESVYLDVQYCSR